MGKKIPAGFDAQYDREYFSKRIVHATLHWEDASLTIDLYEEEVDAGQPDVMTDRMILGEACLSLLIDADAFKNRERRQFVERLIGPTWPIDLIAIKSGIVEFRDWATTRIVQEEEREAARSRVTTSPAPPQADDLF